jgi:hypothetical protein
VTGVGNPNCTKTKNYKHVYITIIFWVVNARETNIGEGRVGGTIKGEGGCGTGWVGNCT